MNELQKCQCFCNLQIIKSLETLNYQNQYRTNRKCLPQLQQLLCPQNFPYNLNSSINYNYNFNYMSSYFPIQYSMQNKIKETIIIEDNTTRIQQQQNTIQQNFQQQYLQQNVQQQENYLKKKDVIVIDSDIDDTSSYDTKLNDVYYKKNKKKSGSMSETLEKDEITLQQQTSLTNFEKSTKEIIQKKQITKKNSMKKDFMVDKETIIEKKVQPKKKITYKCRFIGRKKPTSQQQQPEQIEYSFFPNTKIKIGHQAIIPEFGVSHKNERKERVKRLRQIKENQMWKPEHTKQAEQIINRVSELTSTTVNLHKFFSVLSNYFNGNINELSESVKQRAFLKYNKNLFI